jgi:hypothetical protein
LGGLQALLQRLFGHLLDLDVDRQLDIVALHRRLVTDVPEDPALGVNLQLLHGRLSSQGRFVGRLDTCLADLIVLLIALGLEAYVLTVADLAHIAEHIGGHGSEGVGADGLGLRLHTGKQIAVLLDVDDRGVTDIRGDRHRLVRAVALVVDGVANGRDRCIEQLGQLIDDSRSYLHRVPAERQHLRNPVVDDHDPVTVDDPSTGGGDGDEANAVVLGRRQGGIAPHDLEVPEPGQEGSEQTTNDHGNDRQAHPG